MAKKSAGPLALRDLASSIARVFHYPARWAGRGKRVDLGPEDGFDVCGIS